MEIAMAYRTAAQVYADGPSESPNQPPKPEIRTLLGQYEAGIGSLTTMLGAAQGAVKASLSDLQAVVSDFEVGDVGVVYAGDNSGVFRHNGAFWVYLKPLPETAVEIGVGLAQTAANDAAVEKIGAQTARTGAEAARDIAAGYADDAAALSNSDLYATTDGIEAIAIPVGQIALIAKGGGAVGDGRGGLFKEVGSKPAHYSWFQDDNGRYFELAGIDRNFHSDLVAAAANDMALGVAVKILVIGDSTDVGADILNPGNGYIANETPSQKTETVLRNIFSNSTITVENQSITGFNTTGFLSGETVADMETRAAAFAAAGGRVVFINLCMNDMQNSTPTVPRDFRFNLLAIERIFRAHDIAVIFKSQNPAFAIPTYTVGNRSKTIRGANYAQVVRDVCQDTGAPCCDIFKMGMRMVATGLWTIQEIFPDGIHWTNQIAGGYRASGLEMASMFFDRSFVLNGPDQFIYAGGNGLTACYPTIGDGVSAAPFSRSGMQLISTNASGAKTIGGVVRVDTTGLDLILSIPIWSDGVAASNVLFDGIDVGDISHYVGDSFGSYYIHDHEIVVARNVAPGFHTIQSSAPSGAGSVGAFYIRTSAYEEAEVLTNPGGGSAPSGIVSYEVAKNLSISVSNGEANAVRLYPRIVTSRLNDKLDVQATLVGAPKGGFLVLHGCKAADGFSSAAIAGLMVGLDETTGYPTLREANGYSTFASQTLKVGGVASTTNLSGADRDVRVSITPGLGAHATVIIGSTIYDDVTLTKPYIGGWLGIRRSGNGTLNVKDVIFIDS